MDFTPGMIMTVIGCAVFVILLVFWIVYLISSHKKMKKILNEHKGERKQ